MLNCCQFPYLKYFGQRLRREIRVWSGLKHPSILSLLGTSMDFGPYEAMVCPWMQDGDLNRFLENSSQTLTLSQRFDIVSLPLAHSANYLPENQWCSSVTFPMDWHIVRR